MPNKLPTRLHLFAAVLPVILLVTGCSPAIRLGESFRVDAIPADYPRLEATAALVMDSNFAKLDKDPDFGPEYTLPFNKALADALLQGSRVLFKNVSVTDTLPTSGVDLLLIPNNFYYEKYGQTVTISFEITVRRTKDNKEWGLLIEGQGHPGVRPVGSLVRHDREIHFIGSSLKNSQFGQALNNTLFYLTQDYVIKLNRRLEAIQL